MKLTVFDRFLTRAKYDSFAPQLDLVFKKNKFKVRCGCMVNNPRKCRMHSIIQNGKVSESKLQYKHRFKGNILNNMVDFSFYSSMRNFLFLMNNQISSVLSFLNVTSLVYSDSWSRSLYHLQIVSLLNNAMNFNNLVFTTFKTLKHCTVYCITIAKELVMSVNIDEDSSLNNVPIIHVKNVTKKNIIFFGIIVLQMNGSLALPDYVGGVGEHTTGVKMTYYWIDYPSDFKSAGKTADFGSCDNEKYGEADKNFLQNMAVDGTGVVDGVVYNLGSCDCNGRYFCFMKVDEKKAPYGLSDSGSGLVPFVTIASNDFKKGFIFVPDITTWTIPGTNIKHNGCLQVDDTGYSLGSKHIDFFVLRKKYYDIWDDLYESPDVEVYEVDTCKLIDYANLLDKKGKVYDNSQPNIGYTNSGSTNSGNYSSNSNSSKTNNTQAWNDPHAGQTCLSWVDTASLNSAKNTTNSNSKNETVTSTTNKNSTLSQSTVLLVPTTIYYKRDNINLEKRGSAARIPSCSGYNCYPVHIMLITTVCVTFALMVFSIVLKRKAPGLIWIFYGFNTIFIIAMLIYCIVALRSVGPLKISVVDSGDTMQKRGMPDFNRSCKNRSLQYQIIMGIGGGFVLIGLILMYKFKNLMNFVKVRYTSIVFNLSCITFGLTISILSFIVYMGYQKCFSGERLKFVCNIAGHLFWSTVVATVTATALMVIHFIIQFFSMSMFFARLDLVRPILSMAFGFVLIMMLVYMDGNACF